MRAPCARRSDGRSRWDRPRAPAPCARPPPPGWRTAARRAPAAGAAAARRAAMARPPARSTRPAPTARPPTGLASRSYGDSSRGYHTAVGPIRIRPLCQMRVTSTSTLLAIGGHQAQRFGHAPGLRRAASRMMRRVTIEDLGDAPEPVAVKMRAQPIEQPLGHVATHPPAGVGIDAEQERPHRALVIGGVARAHVARGLAAVTV